MEGLQLIKQAVADKGKANLSFSGKSMYPTLKDSMVVTISRVLPEEVKVSDIITYKDSNLLVAHRVIDIIRDKNEIVFITKGDNQPFGGIGQVRPRDLISRVERAFYKDHPQENVLNKNICYRLLFVWLGRTYLFYRKFLRKYLPEFLRIALRDFIKGFYFVFSKFTYLTQNLW